nr:serine/threonine-protein kinase [Kofleriaceae bacterium]
MDLAAAPRGGGVTKRDVVGGMDETMAELGTAQLGKTAIGTAPSAGTSIDRMSVGAITDAAGTSIDLSIGAMFRGLRIRSLLGAGAMGNAYLASHASLRTPVVIKLFRTTVAGADPLAEAHLAARVVSPQVVPVLDAGVEQGLPYVMQRYVDGIDLEELLAIHAVADRALPMAVLLRIAVDVLHGLSAIHVAGVVHRDIKPPNLFLAGSGEALVGDFGIAVDPTSPAGDVVAGTPMFIAPELWSGAPATPRSDLYSTAATLHLLWQRRAPFVADNLAELADLHRDAPYVPPQCGDPVAAYFGAVLAMMMQKAPTARPESALGVARQLERIATPRPELRGHRNGTSRIGDIVVQLEQRDLCTATTDVVVSASNEQLVMRQGVADALRRAGGDDIEREAKAQGPITMGQVVWTGPGTLPCKAIAHAAAALDGAVCIQRSVLRTLFEAERRGFSSLTFPALGTGIGDVPHGLGARLMLEAIRTFSAFEPASVRAIRVALPTAEAVAKWTTALVALDADAGHR